MGKISTTSEPIFTPIKTTDDDDDDDNEQLLGNDGGPPTTRRYRDDPQSVDADDGGPPVRFSDDPERDSIFDWGDSSSRSSGNDDKDKKKGGKSKKSKKKSDNNKDIYQMDDFDMDATGFAPVSLNDSDSSGDEENGSPGDDDDDDDDSEKKRIRIKANKILNQRIFDDTNNNKHNTSYDSDDEDDRIFVGGGWGRHGSQFSCCPHGLCGCCTRKDPTYSVGPSSGNNSNRGSWALCRMVVLGMTFCALVFGAGYGGYEAGLPVEEEEVETNSDLEGGGGNATPVVLHKTHTKGEEWLQWLEKEKTQIHLPHWKNFALHHTKRNKQDPAFKKPIFDPMTQSQLLHLSENIFQSCSERSLRTSQGRAACMSQCYGHFCCFEKEAKYGSCVPELNSYCFAYAACENIVTDFRMNNVANTGGGKADVFGVTMNVHDVDLLSDVCSEVNVATRMGKRDCTVLCEHHFCCFDTPAWGNCVADASKECQAYDSCSVLVKDQEVIDAYGVSSKRPDTVVVTEKNKNKNKNNNVAAVAVSRDFQKDCLDSNLYQNWDICQGHCTRFECCFRAVGSCYDEQKLECDEYYICEQFYADDGVADADTAAALDHSRGGNQLVSREFNDNCMQDNLNANWDICKKYCTDYKCCFDDRNGCYDERYMECDAYFVCEDFFFVDEHKSDGVTQEEWEKEHPQEMLSYQTTVAPVSEDVNADVKDAIHAVCNPHNNGEGMIGPACQALCSNYLCCFSFNANCRPAVGEDVCDAYQECSLL